MSQHGSTRGVLCSVWRAAFSASGGRIYVGSGVFGANYRHRERLKGILATTLWQRTLLLPRSALGAIAIADMLRTNRTLTDLALGGNGIRAQGAVALAAALERNTSIVKINLAHNQIGADSDVCTEAAVGALATAIEKNKTIKVILMNRNSICHEFRNTLIAACQKNNASGGVIEYFSVGDTRWTNAPATAISVAPVEVTQAWEVDPDLELEGSTAAEPFLSKAPY